MLIPSPVTWGFTAASTMLAAHRGDLHEDGRHAFVSNRQNVSKFGELLDPFPVQDHAKKIILDGNEFLAEDQGMSRRTFGETGARAAVTAAGAVFVATEAGLETVRADTAMADLGTIPDAKLAQQLLSACVVAQYIDASMQGTKVPVTNITRRYFDMARFQEDEPVFVQGGYKNNDCGIVAQTDYGVVVAFRGTIEQLSDWVINDADVKQNPFGPRKGEEDPRFPGKVHNGFYESSGVLWSEGKYQRVAENYEGPNSSRMPNKPPIFIQDEIKKRLKGPGGKTLPLYITGHSKGAAMASVTAVFAATCLDEQIAKAFDQVHAFASPRLGNDRFMKAYNKEIEQYTFENRDDVVPLVPFRPRTTLGRLGLFFFYLLVLRAFVLPSSLEYLAVGKRFIFEDGNDDIEGCGMVLSEDGSGERIFVVEPKGDDTRKSDYKQFWSILINVVFTSDSLGKEHAKESEGPESSGKYQKMLTLKPFSGADPNFYKNPNP